MYGPRGKNLGHSGLPFVLATSARPNMVSALPADIGAAAILRQTSFGTILTRHDCLSAPFPLSLFAQALSQMTFLAALLVAVVFGGVCNDKKTDCANWARDGECAGDNAVRALPCALTARVSVQQLHLLIF